MQEIDLRSDTVTRPTPAMRKAMAEAVVGDDVSGDDPTVKELEAESAKLLKKEAALFVPTGVFANQCAIHVLAKDGDEVLLAERCHIIQHEAGAAAVWSRVQLRAMSPDSSHLLAADVDARIRHHPDIHYPKTGLICVEQATSDGTVTPLETLADIHRLGMSREIPVYMDGARLFNAAASLNVEPSVIAAQADAVGFCLSKGLCAPAGSVLVGSVDFIRKARRARKLFGGGMRQVGVLAAPGLVALREVRPKLKEDHEKARILARLLKAIRGVEVLREPEINMVFARIEGVDISLVPKMFAKGIRIYPDEGGVHRFVTHQQVSEEALKTFAAALAEELKG